MTVIITGVEKIKTFNLPEGMMHCFIFNTKALTAGGTFKFT